MKATELSTELASTFVNMPTERALIDLKVALAESF